MSVWDKLKTAKPLTSSDVKQPVINDSMLQRISSKSFVDLLKVRQFLGDGIFFLRDGSLGAMVKIRPLSIEAFNGEQKQALLEQLSFAFKNCIPNNFDKLWVSQMFVVKEQNPDKVLKKVSNYCQNVNDKFTQHWLSHVENHLDKLSSKNGGFIDRNTNQPFALSQLSVYFCFWQESVKKETKTLEESFNKIQGVLHNVSNAFEQAHVKTELVNTQTYLSFLASFFHDKAIRYETGGHVSNILDEDISETALNGVNITANNESSGVWCFEHKGQKKYCLFLALEKILGDFTVGHLTAEQSDRLSLLDKFPIGSIWAQTTVHLHEDLAGEKLDKIIKQSLGKDNVIADNKEAAKQAKEDMASGDLIYRFGAGLYISCDDMSELLVTARNLKSVLSARKLTMLDNDENPLAQDDYLRFLPFGFSDKYDQKSYIKRTMLQHVSSIAKLSPFYTRETGTGSAALLKFNRGGEPFFFDPLADRVKNAFGLIFGPMGSGKSAFLVDFLLQMIAVYRPRVFIIEKGNSFGLLLKHCESLGLTTHSVSIKSDSADVKLPPFSEATKLLDEKENNKVDRDLLGEMLIIAKLMITGGEEKEDDKFERSDWTTLSDAIVLAAKNTIKGGRQITLTEDVIRAIEEISKSDDLTDLERERVRKMAKAMKVFIATPFSRSLFNTEGELFPESDITQLDVGILGDEGYADKLAVAFISLMSTINLLVESKQNEDRPTLILVDEAHLITTNPLLAPYVVKIAKMWRKLGAWLWLATQSLDDYSDKSKQMLKVMEWWICLSMSKAEVDSIAEFKDISEAQKKLLNSTVKSKQQYTEGVVLSDKIDALFRNVPCPLSLALAMTEKDEKAQRQSIMNQHNCSELEAAYLIAEQMSQR